MAARGNQTERKKLPFAANIIILVICAVLLAAAFKVLLSDVNDQIVNANTETVQELVLHDKNNIRNSIELRWDTMEGAERRMAARQWTSFEELTDAENALLNNIPDADRVGLLDAGGTLYLSTGIVRQNSYYKEICEGRNERFVIRLNTESRITESEKEALIEAVPVSYSVCGKEMKWMICEFPVSDLESDLKIGSYDDNGFSSVIDAEGNYILNISETHSFGEFDNLFDGLKDAAFEGYGSIDEVRAATSSGSDAVSVIYSLNGRQYLMVISSFDFADWYIVSVVPMSVFSAQSDAIINRFMILLGIITVILAAVLYLVFRQRKERETAEQERYLRETESRQKLIDGITAAYNVAYVVNMADDSFEQLRMDETIIGHEQRFETFTEAKEFFLGLLLPTDRDRMRQKLDYGSIRQKLAGSKSFDTEYRVPINGAMTWHTMNVTSIDEDTVTIGFAVNDLEITKKHLEDKRFSEYFALYEIDFDTETAKIVIDSPYYPVDRSGTAVPYREAMTAFANSLEGEARAFFEKLSDISLVKKAFAGEDKYSYTYRSRNVDGEKWVDLTSFVTLRHADGSPAMFTLGFSYIDTFGAQKQELQSQIARQKAELEEALTFTDFFLEPYDSAYYIGLKDLSWRVYKRQLQEETEYPTEENYIESLGRYINTEVHPDYREMLSVLVDPGRLRAELAEKHQLTMDYLLSSRAEEKWYRCFAIRGASDDYVALSFIDITSEIEDQKKREKELTDALKMAESANRAKTDFLFSMSHDIRTPMNAITGFTAMAKKYIDDKAAVTDYLEKIDASGKQLLSLVNNVLEMARIESGTLVLDETPVNIRQAFNAMTTVLSEQAQINGQEFNYSLEGVKHFNVFADESKVSSITLNIVSNSLKYTPEGGRIDFRLKEIAGRRPGYATYLLTVADTGIGMSRDFLETIFDPFTRVRSSTVSGIQGTGLGMAIVKRYVDLMGGDITVQSEPGKGSRFEVTIDFRINEEDSTQAQKADAVPAVSFKGMKVLLVEDNELNREIAIDILEEEDLEVEYAVDGSAAVERMKEKGPDYYDFVLMDIQMPVMNGYEATKAIRAMYPDAKIPIIAISANAFEEDKKASKEAGLDDHVAKPINIGELFGSLAKYL